MFNLSSFTDTRTALGRVDYRGDFLLDSDISHELRQLDLEVIGKIWQFRRPRPYPIDIRLFPDGSIESDHPNETFWGWEGDQLVFYDAARSPTTRFRLGKDHDARITWSGPFLADPTITHELAEWNIDLNWDQTSQYISWLPGPR